MDNYLLIYFGMKPIPMTIYLKFNSCHPMSTKRTVANAYAN